MSLKSFLTVWLKRPRTWWLGKYLPGNWKTWAWRLEMANPSVQWNEQLVTPHQMFRQCVLRVPFVSWVQLLIATYREYRAGGCLCIPYQHLLRQGTKSWSLTKSRSRLWRGMWLSSCRLTHAVLLSYPSRLVVLPKSSCRRVIYV